MKIKIAKLVLMTLSNMFGEIAEILGTVKTDTPDIECTGCAAPAPAAPAPAAPAPAAPAPAAPAPAAPAPAAPAPAVAEDLGPLDEEGLPWDKRIHSSGKTKYKKRTAEDKQKGCWTLKRGVDAILVAQVKSEWWKKIYGEEIPFVPGGPAPAAPAPAAPAPAAPAPAAPAPAAEFGTITSWGELMRQVVGNGIDRVLVDSKCVELGVANLAELQNSPNLIPYVAQVVGLTK